MMKWRNATPHCIGGQVTFVSTESGIGATRLCLSKGDGKYDSIHFHEKVGTKQKYALFGYIVSQYKESTNGALFSLCDYGFFGVSFEIGIYAS